MKPKSIDIRNEAWTPSDSLGAKKMSIETPLGNLESDTGSNALDFMVILAAPILLYLAKKFIDNFFNKT